MEKAGRAVPRPRMAKLMRVTFLSERRAGSVSDRRWFQQLNLHSGRSRSRLATLPHRPKHCNLIVPSKAVQGRRLARTAAFGLDRGRRKRYKNSAQLCDFT